MKKTAVIAIMTLVTSSVAQAHFTGWYLGGEIGSNKHQLSIPYDELHASSQYSGNFESQDKKSTGLSLLGGFGFQFGQSNFIGQGEMKYRFAGGAKSSFEGEKVAKEKANVSFAYLQGYKISERFLPYAKVSVDVGVFDIYQENIPKASYVSIENSGVVGFGFGAGIKYAVTDSISLGVEYHKSILHGQNKIKFKTNNIGLNMSYHF